MAFSDYYVALIEKRIGVWEAGKVGEDMTKACEDENDKHRIHLNSTKGFPYRTGYL
jgi:hypothetical protein